VEAGGGDEHATGRAEIEFARIAKRSTRDLTVSRERSEAALAKTRRHALHYSWRATLKGFDHKPRAEGEAALAKTRRHALHYSWRATLKGFDHKPRAEGEAALAKTRRPDKKPPRMRGL
jgi:hypothetical protein